MIIKRYIKGIAFAVLMLSFVLIGMAATPIITDPTENPKSVPSTVEDPKTFNITVNQTMTVSWYINGTIAQPTNFSVTTASYTNTSAAPGSWNISAIAENENGTVMQVWNWIVTAAALVAPNINSALPSGNPTSYFGVNQVFNVTADQTGNFTWFINGSQVQTNSSMDAGTLVNYENNSAGIGTYNITVQVNNTNGTDYQTWFWTVKNAPDLTPPASITNLTMESNGTSWIKWNWTNPQDPDFKYVAILINNGWHNTSSNLTTSFNSSDAGLTLGSGTAYTIATLTVDTSGNVNSSWVNLTNSTLPNTPVSPSAITITLSPNSSVTFPSVTGAGNTLEKPDTSGHTLPSASFTPVGSYLNISTSATYTAPITVSVKYNTPLPSGYTDSDVRLYHWNDSTGQWDNVTISFGSGMVTGRVSSLSPFVPAVPKKPVITKVNPADPIVTAGSSTQKFDITVSQDANITWTIGSFTQPNSSVPAGTHVTLSYTLSSPSNYTVLVTAANANGSDTKSWNWTVHPKTYYSGNRIWDGSKEMSSTYTWDVYSFSGFYYSLDDDLGNESLTIKNIDRSLAEGDITYSTSPEEVSFEHSDFGEYQVIGFMADKYFAGYTANSTPSGNKPKSTIGSSQLHRVLLDDDDKRTVSEGGTLTLQEGYVLKVTAVDIGAGAGQVWITLLKDGSEVDSAVVAGKDNYYYTKKVGSVSDLPVIAVHFDSVFRGREVNAVFIRGTFQISESYTQVKSGSKYGVMEIDSASSNEITMKNSNTVDLSAGNTIDLMGNLKIEVADNSTLRFGLTVETTGTFEARGTIYNRTDAWTPMNFGLNVGGTSIGFYYDMDEDIGNENLTIVQDLTGRTSISQNGLKYSTSPQEVSFEHENFGSYQVIGFMADKYFAGYTTGSKPSGNNAKSTIGSSQLHKVLLDDNEKRTVSEGGTLTLKEGYVLKVTAVDIGAGAGQVWITLLKDGSEVDSDVVAGNEDYYYTKKVGSVSDLPVIAVHFDSVFRGREVNAVFIRGVFQISESYTQVKSGNKYGAMEITGASSSGITMENDNAIDLSAGSTSDVMGNITFRVADSGDLRFYPFVMVTSEMVANQLVIDAPAKASAGDNITIKVTAGGSAVDNAAVSIDSEIGNTDSNGVLYYTLPVTMKGTYNITATKLGYEKASRSIEIAEYIEYRLTLDIPAKINQFETLTIQVKYNDTAIGGAAVKYDNDTIGTTDNSGALNYIPQASGTHTISASKSGYITVIRDVEVIAPFSQYTALDINITPALVYPGQNVVIRSNITNVGTKADTLPVDLIINGSVVDNRSVALDPHETEEINFTGNLKQWMNEDVKPGNYTVAILNQKTTIPVQEEPLNILLIGGIITGLGLIAIYILTSKKLISVKAIKGKLNLETVNKAVTSLRSKIANLASKFAKK